MTIHDDSKVPKSESHKTIIRVLNAPQDVTYQEIYGLFAGLNIPPDTVNITRGNVFVAFSDIGAAMQLVEPKLRNTQVEFVIVTSQEMLDILIRGARRRLNFEADLETQGQMAVFSSICTDNLTVNIANLPEQDTSYGKRRKIRPTCLSDDNPSLKEDFNPEEIIFPALSTKNYHALQPKQTVIRRIHPTPVTVLEPWALNCLFKPKEVDTSIYRQIKKMKLDRQLLV